MNTFRTPQRISRPLAFMLSSLLHVALVAIGVLWIKNHFAAPSAFPPAAMNLGVVQIALQAAEPRLESRPEWTPPETVQVAIHPEPEKPQPQTIAVDAVAQVTQAASAPTVQSVDTDRLRTWVREQIEKEKYYPPAARKAGYEGQFRLRVRIGTDGKVSEAVILDGKGPPVLFRALAKILSGLPGREVGKRLPEPVEMLFEFEFKLA